MKYSQAQNNTSNNAQYKEAGGELLFSGKEIFSESWTSSTDSRAKGLYWQGGFYDKEEDRNYQPWEDVVKNSVSPLVGNITVTGPGNICVKQNGDGARIKMTDIESQQVFTYCNLNNRATFNGDFWGFVAENTEVTLDIHAVMSAYNNMINTGEYAFHAPQDVEYEIWFFPGGDGAHVVKTSGDEDPDPDIGNIVFGKEETCETDDSRQEMAERSVIKQMKCDILVYVRELRRDYLLGTLRKQFNQLITESNDKWDIKIRKWEARLGDPAYPSVPALLRKMRMQRHNEEDDLKKRYQMQIDIYMESCEIDIREINERCQEECSHIIGGKSNEPKVVSVSKSNTASVVGKAGGTKHSVGNNMDEIILTTNQVYAFVEPYQIKAKKYLNESGSIIADYGNVYLDNVKAHFNKAKKLHNDASKIVNIITTQAKINSKKTEFIVSSTQNITEVCVIEGLVTVSPLHDECDQVSVSGGQCVTINSKGSVSDYVNYDPNQDDKWWDNWPLIVGIDDEEISKIDGGVLGDFLDGFFDIEIKESGKTFASQWVVTSEGSLVDIFALDENYPYANGGYLKAFIDGEKIFIYNKCLPPNSFQDCDQVFVGTLNDGIVSGEFRKNGKQAGTWSMHLNNKAKNQSVGQLKSPISDSHVYQYSYSNWNKADWGAYNFLGAGYHPTGGEKRTFMKFDIQDIHPNEISKAVLRLYHHHTGGQPTIDLGIYEVTTNWEEGNGTYKPHSDAQGNEVCWINQPDFIGEAIATFSPGEGTNKWVEVDISTLVRDWAAGMPNQGLMIKATGSLAGKSECQYGFYSREYEEWDKRPQLLINPMNMEGDDSAIYINEGKNPISDDYDASNDAVAGVLHGLRWEMPCNSKGNACSAKVQQPMESATLGGDPDQLYEVTLRFRGVVEYHSYTGGKQDGLWYIGGRSNQGSYNIYQLEITDPPQTYFLNAERAGISRCWSIDYTRKIQVRGGSKVILSANAQDGALISNHDDKGNPIVIPGIPPAPEPYDGQFIQMDVLSVMPVTHN